MNIFTAKLPVDTIKDAIKAVNNAKKQIYALEQEKELLGLADMALLLKLRGKFVVEERKKKAEEINTKIAEIQNKTLKILAEYRKTAEDFVNVQFIPDGKDIIGENAADVALLQSDIISTPEKLTALIQCHDNMAFKILAARYAKSHDWDGFECLDKEESIKNYCKQVFENLETAAHLPFGVTGEQYTGTLGEYRRIAEASGLTAEFDAANGNSIDSVIVSRGDLNE